jgi:hypothetical protein
MERDGGQEADSFPANTGIPFTSSARRLMGHKANQGFKCSFARPDLFPAFPAIDSLWLHE